MNNAAGPKTTVNRAGMEKTGYRGQESTLCLGCGHNSIVSQIVSACYELSLIPEQVIKLSGIGCSSKAPTYFLNRSHGFNGLHGRMPSMATGAVLANPELRAIGMSGDGDTANIGMGQFKHLVRRNVPMVYIVANNGVYGLTKGQFSATADYGLELKRGERNILQPVDICHEALAGGATFVARSFAGDPKQLAVLLKAALSHHGTAVLDVISPCVTFNNRETSPKSYAYGRSHEAPLHEIDFIPAQEEIRVDYAPGTEQRISLHDGSEIRLRKLGEDYDPTDRAAAEQLLERARRDGLYITGLLYLDSQQPSFVEVCRLDGTTPLARLGEAQTRPSPEMLQTVIARFA